MKKCEFDHNPIVKTSEGCYVSNSEIPGNVRFVGNSTIGDNCEFGKNVIIEDSIILDNIKISDNTYISNSIVGNGEHVSGIVSDKILFGELCRK